MRQQILLDTGPIIALIDRRDHYHSWVTTELATIQPPLLSSEAVISEAWFLLQRVSNGRETLVGLLKSQQILVAFQLHEEIESITELLTRYLSVPISFCSRSESDYLKFKEQLFATETVASLSEKVEAFENFGSNQP